MAFDFLTPAAVDAAFRRRKLSPTLAAAFFFREGRDWCMQALCNFVDAVPLIPYTLCEKTGATDTTAKWNAVSEDIFREVQPIWEHGNCGIVLNGARHTSLQWADNWY